VSLKPGAAHNGRRAEFPKHGRFWYEPARFQVIPSARKTSPARLA